MRDENGKLYMIWKEDGNSVNKPTRIWAMPMKEDRSALVGEKVELFRNDQEWEKNLVEGVSIIRHSDYFYAFYAASGCCGRSCNYVTGIARSKKLLGPWEKFAGNPILKNEGEWICPGHGTTIVKDDKFYFLYHAYNKDSHVFAGRQGLLREFTFTPDGWIKFAELDQKDVEVPAVIADEFNQTELSDSWQWSVFREAKAVVKQGKLYLPATSDKYRTYVGRRTFDNAYKIRAVISRKESTAQASVALIGDDRHMAGVSVDRDKLKLFKVDGDLETIFLERDLQAGENIFIEIGVTAGKNMTCSYSTDGVTFEMLNEQTMDGDFLPPWDRAVRAGVASMGSPGQQAVFESFTIFNSDKP
jgi:beta-xylosidase